ncbi:MAG: YggT family protein [Pseudomonadota bacterium]|nr:YggT family protein [Pseudomonadota bacterium]
MDIVSMVFNIVISVATLLLFLRFLMQLFAVDRYNPVVISTVRATHVADVFARILPVLANGRIHLAAIVLIVLLRLMELSGNSILGSGSVGGPIELLVMTVISLLQSFLKFCYWLILGSIILSWVSVFTQAQSPYIDLVRQLAEPLYAPFRKILPDLGPIDLSPMIAFLIIIVSQRLLDHAAYTIMLML